MERPRPEINLKNFLRTGDIYARVEFFARMDLAADRLLSDDVTITDRLKPTNFEPTGGIEHADPETQLAWLGNGLRTRLTEAVETWHSTQDDEQWTADKHECSLWYQAGIHAFQLLSQDVEAFAELYNTDRFAKSRYTQPNQA